ncbi:hypothetical protein QBC40DRAFT_3836 [Triangularia verruculosa]|uniref:Uncharacterized protein n=1 Tax=Triangularia verruculosa TaxID=2587418 RepID=A0AAN6XB99_9PEZI|nr:hypothetical protein QBC40DRAFT_3836 [Triangularia verruculosa]
MRRHIHYSLLSVFCYVSGCIAVNKCFYPGGGESLDDVPCDADAEVSVCCGSSASGGACLSNKLCMGTDGKMSRGSCTDKTFLSPECPNFCSVLRQGIVVTPCLNGNDSSTTHCCFLDRNCCNDESAQFEAPPAQPVPTATWNRILARYVTVRLESSTSLPSTSKSTGSTDTTAPPTSTTASSTQTTSTSGNVQSQPQQQSSEALPPTTTAGIAIGAIVGAALITAVIYLLWRLNKSQKILEQAVVGNQAPFPENMTQYSHSYTLAPPQSPFYHSSQHSYTTDTESAKELPSDRSAGELYAGPLPTSYSSGKRFS